MGARSYRSKGRYTIVSPKTMNSFDVYKYNGGRIQARGNSSPPFIFLLIFVFLWTGLLICNDEGRHGSNDKGGHSTSVEAFSFASPTSLSKPRQSFSLLVQRTEGMITDDQHSFANDTISYSDVINIVADAQYMDTETKKRFVESLQIKISDAAKDAGETLVGVNKETNLVPEKIGVETKGCQIPTIEGSWKDDGGPFHASGAWQTAPLFMKGAFVDDIKDLMNEGSYPFPSWKEMIELACEGGGDEHDEIAYEDGFSDSEDNESEFEKDDNDDDEIENQYVAWAGDGDDVDGFEDGAEDFFLWDDEDDENSDHPPSRLIQYYWPRIDDSNYYHSDVNTNWLDTFEINQFGPFNDPDSLEALLQTEDNENTEKEMARTLLVNDVDRWFPKLSDWMDRRFNNHKSSEGSVLPARWRRDDAQISLSYPKGGIGPHVDDYDVFLIQLEGERTWDVLWEDNSSDSGKLGMPAMCNNASKISVRDETNCMLPESSMNGVRILNITKLQSLQEDRCGKAGTRLTRLHLRPGDCLYLPPRVLHCGTAIEASANCMTLSVGCRAPSALELLDGLSDLMKKSAASGTPQATSSPGSTLPSSTALQAFHERYTNTKTNAEQHNSADDTHSSNGDSSMGDVTLPPLQSSWLSPEVKDEMKTLALKAVKMALDDDANILDPLVGRFVTKSNRLEEDQFDLGVVDALSLPSYAYPKKLRSDVHDNAHNEGKDNDIYASVSASTILQQVFDKPETEEETKEFVLRRAEGISFAWSSVYDKDLHVRRYRLYAQGRPPFEVLEDEEKHDSIKQVTSAPTSILGRLMDRIANGAPLSRAFVVDELRVLVDFKQEGSEYTIARLLYDLVDEGLLYKAPRFF